jgi:hypothetical protein
MCIIEYIHAHHFLVSFGVIVECLMDTRTPPTRSKRGVKLPTPSRVKGCFVMDLDTMTITDVLKVHVIPLVPLLLICTTATRLGLGQRGHLFPKVFVGIIIKIPFEVLGHKHVFYVDPGVCVDLGGTQLLQGIAKESIGHPLLGCKGEWHCIQLFYVKISASL